MRKGSDVTGLPVITRDTGEQKESVKDILFDQDGNHLLGLLIDEGGWFSEARVIPWDNVLSIGPDAVIIATEAVIRRVDQLAAIERVLERDNILKGTRIMTTDGQDLGTMEDLYFDDESGMVVGYEVSGGLFSDAMEGRSYVPAPKTLTIGEDVAFVPPETATMMEEQVGGLKGAVADATAAVEDAAASGAETLDEAATTAKEKAQEVADQATETLDEAASTAQAKTREVTDQAADALDEATTTAQEKAEQAAERLDEAASTARERVDSVGDRVGEVAVEQARGRRARETVRTDDGRYVVAEGQIVTDHVVERALRHERGAELLAAVGLGAGDVARQGAVTVRGGAESAGETIAEGAQSVADEASSLWNRVTDRVSEIQEEQDRLYEQRRIERALGRPVTRVILDRDDNVILDTGELVTHASIERAREADVLKILLDSVSMQEPELDPSALRAGSALERSDEG